MLFVLHGKSQSTNQTDRRETKKCNVTATGETITYCIFDNRNEAALQFSIFHTYDFLIDVCIALSFFASI